MDNVSKIARVLKRRGFKFLQKRVSRLDKKASAHFCIILGVVVWKNHVAKPLNWFNKCRKMIFLCRKTFFCRNLKIFWATVMLIQPRVRASRASPGQKWLDLMVVCFKNFSRATFFFVFWSTQMVDRYLSYLPVKQIWWKSAVHSVRISELW